MRDYKNTKNTKLKKNSIFIAMNFSRYIATRILNKGQEKNNISSPIVKIGITGIALGVAVMIITMAVVTGFQQRCSIVGPIPPSRPRVSTVFRYSHEPGSSLYYRVCHGAPPACSQPTPMPSSNRSAIFQHSSARAPSC